MAATRVQTISSRRIVGNPSSILQVLYTPPEVTQDYDAWKKADVAGSDGNDQKLADAREELRQIKLGQMFFNFEKYKITSRTRRKIEIYDTAVIPCLLYMVRRRRFIVRLQRRVRAWLFHRRQAAYRILHFIREMNLRWEFRCEMAAHTITSFIRTFNQRWKFKCQISASRIGRFFRVSHQKLLRHKYKMASRIQYWYIHCINMRRMTEKLHEIEKQQKIARFAKRIIEGDIQRHMQLVFGAWCKFWRTEVYKKIMGASALKYATSLDDLERKMDEMRANDPTSSPPSPEDIFISSNRAEYEAAHPDDSSDEITERLQEAYANLTKVETPDDVFLRQKIEELRKSRPDLDLERCEELAAEALEEFQRVDSPEDMFRRLQEEEIRKANPDLRYDELLAEVDRRTAEIFGNE